MASGVLANVDEFVAAFFGRGAIKATVFRAKGMAKDARLKLKAWWLRFATGVKNAWSTGVFSATELDPVVIGEGLESLENQALTEEKRQDISAALGIPQTLLFQSANFATAKQDSWNFYDQTVIPEMEFIQEVLNTQVFEPMGFQLQFLPETLDIRQADEKERSLSYAQYIGAGMPPSVVVQILGIELPDGVEPEDLDPEEEDEDDIIAQGEAALARQRQIEAESQDARRSINPDMERWLRISLNRLKSGKSPVYDFKSNMIDDGSKRAIMANLENARTPQEVRASFGVVVSQDSITDFSSVVASLDRTRKELRDTAG
jgi:hypothetical protein